MTGLGSVEAVVAAVREDAQAEIERIARERDAAADRLRQEDAALPVIVADADARVAAARREARELAAAVDWADRESRAVSREAWMQVVLERARRQLRDAPADARRDDLQRLAREALEHLPAGDCDLLVAPHDVALLDAAWRDALARETARAIAVVPWPAVADGCVAQMRGRQLQFDNTAAARERRREPKWRQVLAEHFERLAVMHA